MTVLFAVAWVVLGRNQAHLLYGLDGAYMRLLLRDQIMWMPFALPLFLNPLQGLADAFFPAALYLSPALAIPAALSDGEAQPLLSYALYAVELMAAAWLIGSAFRLAPAARLAGGWFLAALALPFSRPPVFYPLYALIPHAVDLLLIEAILVWTFTRLGERAGTARNLALSLVIVALPAYAVLSDPLLVITIVAATAAACLVVLVRARGRALWWRLGALAALGAAMLAGGFAEFLLGATLYTVPAVFADELLRTHASSDFISVAFQGAAFTLVGRWLVLAAGLGAAWTALTTRDRARDFALLHLALTAATVVGGWALLRLLPDWRGPQMLYFETALWPAYCLFAAAFGERALRSVAPVIARRLPAGMAAWKPRLPVLAFPATTAVLVAAIALPTLLRPREAPGAFVYPQAETPIIRALRAETALAPGAPFRGSVATFTGGDLAKPIVWFDQHAFDAQLTLELGNDHRLIGLWQFGIPTLIAYSQYLTPPFYLVLTRMLARPQDRQMRNIVALTVPEPAFLQAVGVRFAIADRSMPAPFAPRQRIERANGEPALVLYELPSPNLGDYSPTRVIRVADAGEALARMQAGIDYRATAIATEALPDGLVPAAGSRLTFERGGFRVRARSPATSLLLLPVQFSHCLVPRAPGTARLVRVNLLQTGVLFSGAIDLAVDFRYGPLGAARCRFADRADMIAIDLKGAARRLPLDPARN